LNERRVSSSTERALEIGELHHGHWRVRVAAHRRAVERDIDHWWFKRHFDRSFLAQALDEDLPALLEFSCLQLLHDLWLDFVEGLVPEPGFDIVVGLLNFRVADRLDLGIDLLLL